MAMYDRPMFIVVVIAILLLFLGVLFMTDSIKIENGKYIGGGMFVSGIILILIIYKKYDKWFGKSGSGYKYDRYGSDSYIKYI